MNGMVLDAIREMEHHRLAIAVGVPLAGVSLATAASVLTPRGKAKGLITGAYMLMASLGGACLIFAAIGLFMGESRAAVVPLLVPGIALTVVMGTFSPMVIREYQQFEFRKLAAEIFRRT
jgi:hypothetical protein